MTESISITIPLTLSALDRASDMLHGLKIDLEKGAENFTPAEIKEADDLSHFPAPMEPVDNSINPFSDNYVTPNGKGLAENPIVLDSVTELDADGLPWDVRIHSKNRSKLAKTDQWKKKRGVAPELVATVEAELHGIMAVPAPQTGDIQPNQPAHIPPPPPAPVGSVTNFPELMAKITGAGIAKETVDLVLQKHAIAALPLLAARPDLIPTVHNELFPL